MDNSLKTGICIFAGLLAVAISIPFAVGKYTSAGRNVTVKGLCEKEVKADRAIWPIVLKEGGNDLAGLSKTVENKTNAIVLWLEDAGFKKEEISLGAPRIENLVANGYDHRSCDYTMQSVITVCTNDVDKVVGMQTKQFELLGKGIAIGTNNWEFPVVYEYTGINDIKPEMIEQATRNARESADKFAKDSGSKVGEIVSASQGQVSLSDRDANTPYIKTIRVVTTINYRLR